MIKIRYLGTCSGTEPMEGMHHCSLVIEAGDANYWFDAGENCSHTAYTSGVDMMKIRAIFISHPHIDHVGGLANLFACLKKLIRRYKLSLKYGKIDIYISSPDILHAAKIICNSGESVPLRFDLVEHGLSDGVIYEDETVKISAVHNNHLKEDGSNGWHSHSFLIESEGKRIIFSGDVGAPSDLDPLIGDGCDLLIMETGHHHVVDVCEYAISHNVKSLRFNHHGREILGDRDAAEVLIKSYSDASGVQIKLCYDTMVDEV